MKKILSICTLTLAVLMFLPQQAEAQVKKKKSDTDEYFDESGGFKHRLWYGGGFIINFSGGENLAGYNSSLFTLGLTPMVGYKIFDELSVGPRFTILYQYYNGEITPGLSDGINLTSYGLGVFARYKFFQQFFVHGEVEYIEQAFIQGIEDAEWVSGRIGRENYYFGGGYSSNGGGPFGYEILVLYNFSVSQDIFQYPFDFRVGFTYNF